MEPGIQPIRHANPSFAISQQYRTADLKLVIALGKHKIEDKHNLKIAKNSLLKMMESNNRHNK